MSDEVEVVQPDLGLAAETDTDGEATPDEPDAPAVETPEGAPEGTDDEVPEGEPEAEAAEDELPSEDAVLAALRETHPELAARIDKAVAAAPVDPSKEAALALSSDDRTAQTFAIMREQHQIEKNIAAAASQHDSILAQIEEKQALLEEADDGSKIHSALSRDIQSLEARRVQLANWHSQYSASKQTLAEVTGFTAQIPELAPYPHDYFVLRREGKISDNATLPQILSLIHAHRAATGRAAKPVMRDTGKPVAPTDRKAVIRKVLAKVGGDKPSGKGGVPVAPSQPTVKLSPAATAALEYAKRK